MVDAISLRAGVVEGGWLPETAAAMAHLLQQQGTSREAEATGQRLGRVSYSHSSFERVGQAVGQLYAAKKTDIDDALIIALEIPSDDRWPFSSMAVSSWHRSSGRESATQLSSPDISHEPRQKESQTAS